ncbi:MAG: hypothetical protein C5B53_04160 [Candidatus Melainabacteria bacterium]|nr:MAG: hypothetical protein C5B53_04160 [Candidatus Melainabacteria bacterium]
MGEQGELGRYNMIDRLSLRGSESDGRSNETFLAYILPNLSQERNGVADEGAHKRQMRAQMQADMLEVQRYVHMLGSSNPGVRADAIDALSGMGDRAVPGLLAALRNGPVLEVRMRIERHTILADLEAQRREERGSVQPEIGSFDVVTYSIQRDGFNRIRSINSTYYHDDRGRQRNHRIGESVPVPSQTTLHYSSMLDTIPNEIVTDHYQFEGAGRFRRIPGTNTYERCWPSGLSTGRHYRIVVNQTMGTITFTPMLRDGEMGPPNPPFSIDRVGFHGR